MKYNVGIQRQLASEFLKVLLPVAIFTIPISIVVSIFPVFVPSRLMVSLLTVAAVILSFYVHKRKKPKLALFLLLLSTTVIFMLAVLINGGMNAPVYVGTIIIMVAIAWSYSARAVILFLALKLIVGGVAVYLYSNNIVADTGRLPQLNYYLFYLLYDLIIVVSLIAGSRLMHNYLQNTVDKENFIKVIFNSIDDSVLLFDNKGNIIRKNSAGKEFIRMFSTDPKVHLLEILLEDEAGDIESFEEILSSDCSNKIFTYKLKNENYWLSITVKSLDYEELVGGKLIIIRDVSEAKRTELQLIQSQKMDTIGQLASGIAHDFNNALSGIVGVLDIFSVDANDEQKEFLTIADSAVEKASSLTRQLLLFSRKNTPASTTFGIRNIVEETVFLLKRSIDKQIEIKEEYLTDKDRVVGDDTQIQSALMNLGINASHAMPDGGVLTFKVERCDLDENFCSQERFDITAGPYVKISVSDTGTGIEESIVERIFDPFFTTKGAGKGTGLGLAGVFGMVKSHHGAIYVYSEVGEGTVFHIYLPYSEHDIESKREGKTIFSGTGRILLIDDEEFIRFTGKVMLKRLGYEVVLAENGLEGVKIYSRDKNFKLVITDMIMPKMNGTETFYKLKEINNECKVLISSGFAKDENLEKLYADGLKGFISKPFRTVELSNAVKNALK